MLPCNCLFPALLCAPCCSDVDIANWVVKQVKLKLGNAATYLPAMVQGIDEEVKRLADLVKGGGFIGLYGPGGLWLCAAAE